MLGALWWKAARDRDAAHDGRVAAEATANALGRIVNAKARQYDADTARLARGSVRWRTVTLPGRVDTLPGRIDTIPAVVAIIEAGDSLAAACDAVRLTCDERTAALTEQRDSLLSALKLSKREARGCRILGLIPCPVVVGGYGVGTSGLGPQITVGIPLGRR